MVIICHAESPDTHTHNHTRAPIHTYTDRDAHVHSLNISEHKHSRMLAPCSLASGYGSCKGTHRLRLPAHPTIAPVTLHPQDNTITQPEFFHLSSSSALFMPLLSFLVALYSFLVSFAFRHSLSSGQPGGVNERKKHQRHASVLLTVA